MNAEQKHRLEEIKDHLGVGNASSTEAMSLIASEIFAGHEIGTPEMPAHELWRQADEAMRPNVLKLLEDLLK